MAATYQTLMDGAPWRRKGRAGADQPGLAARLMRLARTGARVVGGVFVVMLGLSLAAALLSYDPTDPSFNSVTQAPARNLIGTPGAYLSDLMLQGFGFASALLVPLFLVNGLRLIVGRDIGHLRRSIIATIASVLALSAALGLVWPAAIGALDAGAGGVTGLIAARLVATLPWSSGFGRSGAAQATTRRDRIPPMWQPRWRRCVRIALCTQTRCLPPMPSRTRPHAA